MSALDFVLSIVVLASIGVGFFSSASGFGNFSTTIENMINQPTTFGAGTLLWYIGLDTWTPAIPQSILGPFSFLSWFYPYASGFIPHFSLFTFLFALIVSIIAYKIVTKTHKIRFWGKGVFLYFGLFAVAWWAWALISWNLMFIGANLAGITSEQAYTIWYDSVTAIENPYIQIFFFLTVPTSALWIGKKFKWAI